MSARTNRHKQYTAMLNTWRKCRDARLGEDVIKLNGEKYLPKLGGQDDDEYAAYKTRGRYYNAFDKTILGHTGLAMRKPLIITAPDALEPLLDDIDRKGADVRGYVKRILEELLEVGRSGTLIDFSRVDESATVADSEGARVYWAHYLTEDILDWRYEDKKLVYVVVRELVEGKIGSDDDDYKYRVLRIDEESGNYVQEIFMGKSETAAEEITPTLGGSPLKEIPFIFHQVDFDLDVDQPPLLDLVNLCLSWYRLKADHMHALHYIALPTPWATGVDEKEMPTTIGPQKIWGIASVDAKVGILEFTGAGVSAIVDELKSMEDQMAVIGARILMPDSVAENTATASTLRSISETSDLASLVIIIAKQLNAMLEFTSLWAGIAGEVDAMMDTKFIPKEMDAQMVTALVATWQSGGIDQDTLIDNFQKAEIIDPEKDIDEMKANIENEEGERMEKAAQAIADATAAAGGNEEEEDDDE